jgi:cyclase
MILEQVTKRTYANTSGEGRGNFGVISLPNYLVTIDSGMYPSVAAEFRTYIEKITGNPVKKLILTHCHADHVFGNQIFSDCEIISSRAMATDMREVATKQWTREKLEETAKMRPDSFRKLDLSSLEITFPTVVFDDSFRFFDDGLEILIKKVDGHALGSSCIYFLAERVLFAGDIIFAKMFPWGGDPTADPDEWIAALKNFLQMDVEKIVPGHGHICDCQEVQAYLDFLEPVADTMKKLILEGRTREEVVEFEGYPEFYASETPERRRDTLAQWYHVYKVKLEKIGKQGSS